MNNRTQWTDQERCVQIMLDRIRDEYPEFWDEIAASASWQPSRAMLDMKKVHRMRHVSHCIRQSAGRLFSFSMRKAQKATLADAKAGDAVHPSHPSRNFTIY